MKIYIGAAIDAAKSDPTTTFENLAKLCINFFPKGIVFNPFTAYRNAANFDVTDAGTSAYVESINYHALEQSDLAVFLVEDSPSFGVPLEIAHREKQQKPCLVFYNSSKKPGIYLVNSIRRNKFGILMEAGIENMTMESAKKVRQAFQTMGLMK